MNDIEKILLEAGRVELPPFDEAKAKIGGFSGMPIRSTPLSNEPVQVFEDSPFWNAVRDSDS